jgi:hypothetical protein
MLPRASLVLATLALGWTLFATTNAAARSACPSDMAQVGESCVDRYEASLVAIDEHGRELGAWSPYVSPGGHLVKAVSRAGVTPQAYTSFYQAKAACENAGKRLCSADEWVTACKGPDHTRYPYGDVRVPHACVDTNRTAPLARYHTAARMYSMAAMNDPRLDQTPNTVARTGEASKCTNAFGVHDMVGNVHEWTDDATFRGGYFLDTRINREGCDYVTTAHEPVYHDYSIGFRCCADAGAIDETAARVDPVFYARVADLAVGTHEARVATR